MAQTVLCLYRKRLHTYLIHYDMNRRTYLATLGAGVASLTGYTALTDSPQLPMIGEGKRGKGEPISVEKTITEDSITYLEDTDEVRYVTVYSGGEPKEYNREPFKQWAKRKCASIGSTVVLPAIRNRFSASVEGIGKGVEDRLFDMVISVDYMISRNQEEEVENKPNVSFSELVEVTPQTVHATVVLDGREYTRPVPVIVQRGEVAQAD